MTMNRMKLWEGQPPASAADDDFRPYLELEPATATTQEVRGAVLICPGGGYTNRAAHEGTPIATAYRQAGFRAFVVQYRVSPHRHPAPLLDVSRALRMIRRNAPAWHVDPQRIAVCGFSAGGHLTASLGVHYGLDALDTGDPLDAISARPDALILSYPVISGKHFRHVGSFTNLLGPDPAPEALALMSLETHVTPTRRRPFSGTRRTTPWFRSPTASASRKRWATTASPSSCTSIQAASTASALRRQHPTSHRGWG